MNKIREKTRQVKKALRDSRTAVKLTAFFLASITILGTLAGSMLSTYASYSQQTVTELQGDGKTDAQLRADGHDGSLSADVVEDQTYATLDFTAQFNVPSDLKKNVRMHDIGGVIMNDGTIYTEGGKSPRFGVGVLSDKNYSNYPLRVVAGEAVNFGDSVRIDGVDYITGVKRFVSYDTAWLILLENGHLYYFGRANFGQGGNGVKDDNVTYYTPIRVHAGEAATAPGDASDVEVVDGVAYLANIANIDLFFHACVAVTNEGAVYTWGENRLHLGQGNTVNPLDKPYVTLPGRVLAGEASSIYGEPEHFQEIDGKHYLYGVKNVYMDSGSMAAVMRGNGAFYHWGGALRISLQDETATGDPNYEPYRTNAGEEISKDPLAADPKGDRVCIKNVTSVSLDTAWGVRLVINGSVYGWADIGRNVHGFLGIGTGKNTVYGARMWAGEAKEDGNYETVDGIDYIANVARLLLTNSWTGVVTKDGKIYVCGYNVENSLGMNTGHEDVYEPTRLKVGNAEHISADNIYTGSDGVQYIKFAGDFDLGNSEIPDLDLYQHVNLEFLFANDILVRSGDYSAYHLDDGNAASLNAFTGATISEILPHFTSLEIYRIEDPNAAGKSDKNNTNANRLECVAFRPHRNRFDNLSQTISVRVTNNGWYRAYYVLDTEILYYIDIQVSDILEDEGTIRPPDTAEMDEGNEAIVGYDTFTKRAIINLRSDYNASDVKDLAAGENFSAVVAADGTVFTWGINNQGQLGRTIIGTDSDEPGRVLAGEAANDGSGNAVTVGGVQYLSHIKQIICGTDHSIAIAEDGRVYTWGRNDSGQLGDNSTADRTTPVRVRAGEAGNTSLGYAAYYETNPGNLLGEYLLCAIDGGAGAQNTGLILDSGDGSRRLYTFGDNTYGQLGNGIVGGAHSTPQRVQAGDIGKWTDWDDKDNRQMDIPGTWESINSTDYTASVKQVDFGVSHMAVLNTSGFVYCAGNNEKHQLGAYPSDAVNGVLIGRKSGTLRYVNAYELPHYNLPYQTLIDSGPSSVRATVKEIQQIAAGENYTMALTGNGVLVGWGVNSKGVLGTGIPVDDYTTIGAIIIRIKTEGDAIVLDPEINEDVDYIKKTNGTTIYMYINIKEIWAGKESVIFKKHEKLYGIGNPANGLISNELSPFLDYVDIPLIVQQGELQDKLAGHQEQASAPALLAMGGHHVVGLFIDYSNNEEREFASWGLNTYGQLGLPERWTRHMPVTDLTSTMKNYVFSGTNATYVLKSHVREFGNTGGEIITTIDTRTFGSSFSNVANSADNPDGFLNRDIIIYENGYYTVEYILNGETVFESVVFTGKDELARYNAKQSDPSKKLDLEDLQENSHILDAPLELIDLEPVQFDTNLTVPSAVDYTFYLRPVFDNTETDSATLPHTDWYDRDGTQDGDISETLYIYGPQPVRGSESDEEYNYYTYGQELLRITPDGTYVDGDTTTSVDDGLKARYMNASAVTKRFDLVNDILPVHTPGTYVAVLVRDGKIVDVQTVDLSAILHVKYVVEGADENLVVPTVGNLYMRAHNLDGSGTVIASYSKQMSTGDADGYTTFALPILNQQYQFRVQEVLPSYYEVDRVTIGDTEAGQSVKSTYTVDFKTHFEYWVTVYMKPSTNDIRLYHWSYGTGRFYMNH